MANDFMRPNNRTTEKIVDKALDGSYGSYEEMKDALRQNLNLPNPAEEMAGMPPTPTAPKSLEPPVATTGPFVRVVYPAGNSRFEIYSDSEAGLDAQEARIRSLYPQQQ
jgi:hypothetical protein